MAWSQSHFSTEKIPEVKGLEAEGSCNSLCARGDATQNCPHISEVFVHQF